jgi:L-methionine (R)-S-oxide reductase
LSASGFEFGVLREKVKALVSGADGPRTKLARICALLHECVDRYDWVGFYIVDPSTGRDLVLGPYVGESTEHVRIPFGRGICGQAAQNAETLVVPDVTREANYLSCSVRVRSEIVLPIFSGERVCGELDIDSHALNAFSPEDTAFLEDVCRLAAGLIPQI